MRAVIIPWIAANSIQLLVVELMHFRKMCRVLNGRYPDFS